eukprot:GILJ01015295.1.p1 GENE.GILJ01015295.1~~GILJ01015295.1.p1  ORF type:complete len:1031 (+),score=128.49 GILJ01015295.1:288-3095(+)
MYDAEKLPFFLHLLVELGKGTVLRQNIPSLVKWLSASHVSLRYAVLPAMSLVARKYPSLLSYEESVLPVETSFGQWLAKADCTTQPQQAKMAFWKSFFASGYSPTVTERDGTPAKDFFTLLNDTYSYTEDQIFNVQTFSLLYPWLQSLYVASTESNQPRFTLNPAFREVIISYCLRLLTQAERHPVIEFSMKTNIDELYFMEEFTEAAVLESIRILELLCSIDSNLVSKIFPAVHKVFERTAPRQSGLVFLAVLEFFLHHHAVVIYDIDPVFKQFFYEYIDRHYTNPLLAMETLTFLYKNRIKLLQSTHVFSKYFPSVLKLVAWFPRTISAEFLECLPLFVGPTSFVDVFHSILDLPLLSAVTEKIVREHDPLKTSLDDFLELEGSDCQRICQFILRNESISDSIWSEQHKDKWGLMQRFCKSCPVSPRVIAACQLTPQLLEPFFEVMLNDASAECLLDLAPVLLARFEHLFPVTAFEKNIRKVLIEKLLLIFRQRPTFLVSLKSQIVTVISDHSEKGKEELVLHLCWAIGEYANADVDPRCTLQVSSDFHYALEVVAFENMSPDGHTFNLALNSNTARQLDAHSTTFSQSQSQSRSKDPYNNNNINNPSLLPTATNQISTNAYTSYTQPLQPFQQHHLPASSPTNNQHLPIPTAASASTVSTVSEIVTSPLPAARKTSSSSPTPSPSPSPSHHQQPFPPLQPLGATPPTFVSTPLPDRATALTTPSPRHAHAGIAGVPGRDFAEAVRVASAVTPFSAEPPSRATTRNQGTDSRVTQVRSFVPQKTLHTTKLMHVVITSLTKLAIRFQDLAPRVVLCLTKIVTHKYLFRHSVIAKANESLRLLKFAGIAASLCGAPTTFDERPSAIVDANSSISFLVQPMCGFVEGAVLHPFTLYNTNRTIAPAKSLEDEELNLTLPWSEEDDEELEKSSIHEDV